MGNRHSKTWLAQELGLAIFYTIIACTAFAEN
jgi:hypothetical protein